MYFRSTSWRGGSMVFLVAWYQCVWYQFSSVRIGDTEVLRIAMIYQLWYLYLHSMIRRYERFWNINSEIKMLDLCCVGVTQLIKYRLMKMCCVVNNEASFEHLNTFGVFNMLKLHLWLTTFSTHFVRYILSIFAFLPVSKSLITRDCPEQCDPHEWTAKWSL